jgi:sec-independent protein translocase protein TatB
MLDVAWPEVMVIGAVALVVIGPKDLPKVMRVLGKVVRAARVFFEDLNARAEQLAFEAEIAEKQKKEDEARVKDHAKDGVQQSDKKGKSE